MIRFSEGNGGNEEGLHELTQDSEHVRVRLKSWKPSGLKASILSEQDSSELISVKKL